MCVHVWIFLARSVLVCSKICAWSDEFKIQLSRKIMAISVFPLVLPFRLSDCSTDSLTSQYSWSICLYTVVFSIPDKSISWTLPEITNHHRNVFFSNAEHLVISQINLATPTWETSSEDPTWCVSSWSKGKSKKTLSNSWVNCQH